MAAIDPVVPQNRADANEVGIINYFSQNRDEKKTSGIIERDKLKVFYTAEPVVVKEGCLKCHGPQEKAYRGRVEKYTGSGGYTYSIDEVIGTFVTYIPIHHALDDVRFTAIKTALVGVVLIIFLIIAIWFFMNSVVTKPIIQLTEITDVMSRGKELGKEIKKTSDDEIGKLYESFNRMRKSVVKLSAIIQRNRKKQA